MAGYISGRELSFWSEVVAITHRRISNQVEQTRKSRMWPIEDSIAEALSDLITDRASRHMWFVCHRNWPVDVADGAPFATSPT